MDEDQIVKMKDLTLGRERIYPGTAFSVAIKCCRILSES